MRVSLLKRLKPFLSMNSTTLTEESCFYTLVGAMLKRYKLSILQKKRLIITLRFFQICTLVFFPNQAPVRARIALGFFVNLRL